MMFHFIELRLLNVRNFDLTRDAAKPSSDLADVRPANWTVCKTFSEHLFWTRVHLRVGRAGQRVMVDSPQRLHQNRSSHSIARNCSFPVRQYQRGRPTTLFVLTETLSAWLGRKLESSELVSGIWVTWTIKLTLRVG